jgi:hypothetical protein
VKFLSVSQPERENNRLGSSVIDLTAGSQCVSSTYFVVVLDSSRTIEIYFLRLSSTKVCLPRSQPQASQSSLHSTRKQCLQLGSNKYSESQRSRFRRRCSAKPASPQEHTAIDTERQIHSEVPFHLCVSRIAAVFFRESEILTYLLVKRSWSAETGGRDPSRLCPCSSTNVCKAYKLSQGGFLIVEFSHQRFSEGVVETLELILLVWRILEAFSTCSGASTCPEPLTE